MPAGTRNRHSLPDAPLSAATRAETMICPAAWPSSTAILWPSSRQPSDVFVAVVSTCARSKRAARSECANARQSEPSATLGSIACFCASLPHSAIRPAPITTVDEIGFGDQPAAEGFHHDAGLDRAARRARHTPRRSAAPASRDRQTVSRSPALKPSGSPALRAAVIGVIGFRDEAVDTFAQQALLVAEGEVHLILLYRRRFPDRGMQARGVHHHAEFLQIMRVTELMQRERLIDRRGLAHHIDRAVDGLLCHLQRE